ncbi:hypothetical protein GCM10009839_49920 [Catenulispora yoronensis]|uniref:Trypsin-co-occurring domain-containing protein n=1 Tax=Catenulispora yoronensis TaxID=450799 RepID=A0ABN2UW26_9ACTN
MIELATVVRDLRDEIERAIEAGRGEDLRFELGTIELEVAVAIQESTGSSGKVRFFVVDFGTDGKVDSTTTHRVKLSLTPHVASAGAAKVYIAGQALPGEE